MSNHFGEIPKHLTNKQKLELKLFGKVFLYMKKPEGYPAATPVYLANCKEHGPFIAIPQGYDGRLDCQKCFASKFLKPEFRLKHNSQISNSELEATI